MGHDKLHASEHTDGTTDPISEATALVRGLMSTTMWSKLDGIAAGATVYTDLMAVAACSGTYEPIISPKNTAFNKAFATSGAGGVCESNDARLSDARTPISHDNTYHSTAYEPAFTHNTAFNLNLETSTSNIKMNGAVAVGILSTVARADHIHATDTSRAASSHTHAATDINSGTLDGDRLPAMSTTKRGGVPATGTPTGLFLKDDGTWATGGSGTDANAIHDNVSGEISLITEKTAPLNADLVIIESNADSNAKRKVQVSNLAGLNCKVHSAAEVVTSTNVGGGGGTSGAASILLDGNTRFYLRFTRVTGNPTVGVYCYGQIPCDFKSFSTTPVAIGILHKRVGTITSRISLYKNGVVDSTINNVSMSPGTTFAEETFQPGSTFAPGDEYLIVITADIAINLEYHFALARITVNRKVG